MPGLSPIRNELRKRHKELGAFDVVLVIESWGSDAVAMGSLVEGTELTERLHGTPHFKLSFEVTPSGVVRDASTLLSVAWRTDPGGAERHAEESLFELSFHLTAKTTRLVTVLGASEKAGSRCAWPAPVLPVGDVARVRVHVSPGRCVLYVNGHEVSSTPLAKVELVGSTARVRGSGRHAEVANASITNLVYSPLKDTTVEDPLTQRLLVRLREERLHDGMQASDLLMVLARLDSLDLHDEGAFCFFLVFLCSFPVFFVFLKCRLVFVPCFFSTPLHFYLSPSVVEGALRTLGQTVRKRWHEFSSDQHDHIQMIMKQCGMPLHTVFPCVGSSSKRCGGEIVTVQAFAPMKGHEKRQRTEDDIERVSPPRMSSDRVQSPF